jgi:general L-amino acid transport system permease protein
LRSWLGDYPLAQIFIFLATLAVLALLGHTMEDNMARVGITPGFAYLWRRANFEIGESMIGYSADSPLIKAFFVGFLNTLTVSGTGCVLATVLGVSLGIARLSTNPLLSNAVRFYVEAIRNTPLLLQLFFWNATLQALPGPRQAIAPAPGFFLCNRGVFFPTVTVSESSVGFASVELVAAVAFGALLLLRPLRERPFLQRKVAYAGLLAFALLIVIGAALGGVAMTVPERHGFNFTGGASLSPEFSALVIGLVINAAAGIAEIVRSGIESVVKGQWEAAAAIGLRPGQVMRLVVLPQALRVIIPQMTSSYLSLAKNSSLAVAIGYPGLVNIANTAANQTGQALESLMIMVVIYLIISFSVSYAMNRYNQHQALKER